MALRRATAPSMTNRRRRSACGPRATSPGVDRLARLLEVDAEPEVVLDLDEQVGEPDRGVAGIQPAVQLGEAVRLRRVGLLGRVRLEPPPVVVERDLPVVSHTFQEAVERVREPLLQALDRRAGVAGESGTRPERIADPPASSGLRACPRRWMPSEDIAVRLADAFDAEDGGRRLLELARRLGRTEAAVRRRAWGPGGPPGPGARTCGSSRASPASNNGRSVTPSDGPIRVPGHQPVGSRQACGRTQLPRRVDDADVARRRVSASVLIGAYITSTSRLRSARRFGHSPSWGGR